MRKNIADNLILDPEYSIELVAAGLTFPTSIAFDSQNRIYIGESGLSYGPAKVEGGGKIKRIDPPGDMQSW